MRDGNVSSYSTHNGNRQALIYGNGNQTEYYYNSSNQVTALINKQQDTVISKYTYDYYLDGNRHSELDESTGEMTTYVYDGLGRLGEEKVTDAGNDVIFNVSYTYDDYNNRESKIDHVLGETRSYHYDKNNRLKEEIVKTAGNESEEMTSYHYDNNGNQIEVIKKDGTEESESIAYDYDEFNRLIHVTEDGMNSQYTYNMDGLRSSKNVNGMITNHIWDGTNIVLEQNGAEATTAVYTRGINLIAYENKLDSVNDRNYYIYNAHGDVVQLTDETGRVVKRYDYDAFGNEVNPDENDTNPFRYCGEYFDGETGSIYLRARYYNPVIGRFITQDTYLGDDSDPLSLNLYTYSNNNPVMYVDPSGHVPRWMSNIGNWGRNVFKSTQSWYKNNHVGAYLHTGAEVVGGFGTAAVSAAAIAGTGGTGGGFAWVSLAHGVNSFANGIRDINHIQNGEFDKVGQENYLRDYAYKPLGKGIGYLAGYSIDKINYHTSGSKTRYNETYRLYGEKAGNYTYYVADIFGSAQGVKNSVTTIATLPKLRNLHTAYYSGNIVDGYKRMNNLKIWENAPSIASRFTAATNLYINQHSIKSNINDIITAYYYRNSY